MIVLLFQHPSPPIPVHTRKYTLQTWLIMHQIKCVIILLSVVNKCYIIKWIFIMLSPPYTVSFPPTNTRKKSSYKESCSVQCYSSKVRVLDRKNYCSESSQTINPLTFIIWYLQFTLVLAFTSYFLTFRNKEIVCKYLFIWSVNILEKFLVSLNFLFHSLLFLHATVYNEHILQSQTVYIQILAPWLLSYKTINDLFFSFCISVLSVSQFPQRMRIIVSDS